MQSIVVVLQGLKTEGIMNIDKVLYWAAANKYSFRI